MKIKFTKNYLSYKADQEVEISDTEAQELIASGKAVEVKVEVGDVAAKAADELLSAVDAKIEAFEKKVAKAFSDRKPSITVGVDRSTLDPQEGYKSLAHFAKSVREGMVHKVPAAHSVGTDADGGYAVPQVWANEIFDDIVAGDSLLALTKQYPMTVGDILNIPADGTTTLGTGMSATWVAEGTAITPDKTILRNITLTPKKLAILTATTEELERDAQALNKYLMDKASYEFTYELNRVIVRGNGSTEPTGFLNHASSVASLRATADTITFPDVAKMFSRFHGDRSKARWIANPETFEKLAQMTSGNFNIYLSGGSIAGAPVATMFGIPVIVHEAASSLGDDGDLCLVDLSKYFVAIKGGVEAASSIHLYFNSVENAYRFVMRVDGKPNRASPLTPASGMGTNTRSPFVSLDAGTTSTLSS